MNLTGCYNIVDIVNDRPAFEVSIFIDKNLIKKIDYSIFQREKNDEDGDEIYLWYRKKAKDWCLCTGPAFKARDSRSYVYIDNQGKPEI